MMADDPLKDLLELADDIKAGTVQAPPLLLPPPPTNTNAFVTGSHAYGTPTAKSDVDLVVLISINDTSIMLQQRDKGLSIRFGKLNLITFIDVAKFNLWRKITDDLIRAKPVTRDMAICHFQAHGFSDSDYKGGEK